MLPITDPVVHLDGQFIAHLLRFRHNFDTVFRRLVLEAVWAVIQPQCSSCRQESATWVCIWKLIALNFRWWRTMMIAAVMSPVPPIPVMILIITNIRPIQSFQRSVHLLDPFLFLGDIRRWARRHARGKVSRHISNFFCNLDQLHV